MDFIVSLYLVFIFPNSIVVAIVVYYNLVKKYKDEFRSDESNSHLSDAELFGKANAKIAESKGDFNDYTEMLNERLGMLKYLLPIMFWVLVFNLIF